MTIDMSEQRDLASLQRRILRLAESVDRAILCAHQSLLAHDAAEARKVVVGDTIIDSLRDDIEREVHQLLAGMRPLLGADLRATSTALVLAGELERIADDAKAIAQIVVEITECLPQELPAALNQMAYKVRAMLQLAIRAVVTRDSTAVERLQPALGMVETSYRSL